LASNSYNFKLEEIPLDRIGFSPEENPRNLKPPDVLVNQIRDKGIKKPPIVYFDQEAGKYLTSNGWQRIQSAHILGIPKIECEVYPSKLQAQVAAIHEDTRTEETDYQQYCRFNALFKACREEGMTYNESIDFAMVARGLSTIKAAENRIAIFRLPPIVQSLMKNSEYRTKKEWDQLEKTIPNIRQYRRKLGIITAALISDELSDRKESYQLAIGIICLKLSQKGTREFIQMAFDNPKVSPLNLYHKYMDRSVEEIKVKTVVNKTTMEKINKACESAHMDLNDMFQTFLDDLITEKKEEVADVGLKESYFDVGKYRVVISPTVSIEGTPSVFYTKWEVRSKAWNSNIKLPGYLKTFLENLTIRVIENLEKV